MNHPEDLASVPAHWIEQERHAAEFTDRLARLAADRLRIFREVRAEKHRLDLVYELAMQDARAVVPIIEAELRHQFEELLAVTKLAIRSGDEEAAREGARALSHAARPAAPEEQP